MLWYERDRDAPLSMIFDSFFNALSYSSIFSPKPQIHNPTCRHIFHASLFFDSQEQFCDPPLQEKQVQPQSWSHWTLRVSAKLYRGQTKEIVPGRCLFQAIGSKVQQNINIGKLESDDDWSGSGQPQDVGVGIITRKAFFDMCSIQICDSCSRIRKSGDKKEVHRSCLNCVCWIFRSKCRSHKMWHL